MVKYLERQLLDHMVGLCLAFKMLQNCLPKWIYYFVFPPAMTKSSYCSTSSPAVGIVRFLDLSHSNRYVIYLIVVLICISLMMSFEYLPVCLFPTCIFSLINCIDLLPISKCGLFVFWILREHLFLMYNFKL